MVDTHEYETREPGWLAEAVDAPIEKMDSASFYVLRDRHNRTVPIDSQAVYGYPRLGDRNPALIDLPIRNDSRDLVTAIRTVRPGERVRVNDGQWLTVVEQDDEGFVTDPPENGSVRRNVQPDNAGNDPPGTFDTPWMRRDDNFSSIGEVGSLEVDWDEERMATVRELLTRG